MLVRALQLLTIGFLFAACHEPAQDQPIQPYSKNPSYWAYKGEPVLLLGGSKEDNLFQIPDLETHLDAIQAAGGNYVRSTMSSRDEGNVWPYLFDEEAGLYDLDQFNPEFWRRFRYFLEATAERDIIVQLEIWATFDFYDDRNMRRGYWQHNPFNPKNNGNYTTEESGLPEIVDSHPTQTQNPFFFSIPNADHNPLLLSYQETFVDRLLDESLHFGHVLYGMDNETSVTPEWGWYWARLIRERAAQEERIVQTTEMWDPWDLAHPMHSNTFDHPELYTFVDVSQNNHQKGQAHWDNAQRQRRRVAESGAIRPLNNVKIYGAPANRFGTERDGIERFWRNIFGGMASARFHRPESGIGLSDAAQAHLTSARMLQEAIDIFRAEADSTLLHDREENEAYAMVVENEKAAVFFTDGGEVSMTNGKDSMVRWLNPATSQWQEAAIEADFLAAPGSGYWIAVIEL